MKLFVGLVWVIGLVSVNSVQAQSGEILDPVLHWIYYAETTSNNAVSDNLFVEAKGSFYTCEAFTCIKQELCFREVLAFIILPGGTVMTIYGEEQRVQITTDFNLMSTFQANSMVDHRTGNRPFMFRLCGTYEKDEVEDDEEQRFFEEYSNTQFHTAIDNQDGGGGGGPDPGTGDGGIN